MKVNTYMGIRVYCTIHSDYYVHSIVMIDKLYEKSPTCNLPQK